MMPMQTIGYLLGIPEGDQANIRDMNGVSLELTSGATPGEASPKIFEESIMSLRGVHRVARRQSFGRPDDRTA